MPYGTLLTDTIKSSTSGPVAFQNTSGTEVGTLCRAWVNFNGTGTVAIRASFNVSSITDNGTGDYTVNFTNALPDANYSAVAIAGTGAATDPGLYTNGPYNAAPTTSAYRFQAETIAGTRYDSAYCCVAVFR